MELDSVLLINPSMIIKVLLGLLMFSVFVFAQEVPHCARTLPDEQQMLKKIQEMSVQAPLKNYGVGGLSLENENAGLIEAYRKLVTYKDTKLRPISDIDFYSRFKESSCHKALCAAQTIFGDKMGLMYLYYSAIYGVNLSPLGYDRLKLPDPKYELEFKAWYTVRAWKNFEEMIPMLKAVVNLPKNISLMNTTRMLHTGIVNPVKESIIANGLISFYLPFDQLSDSEKETVTYHELGHSIATENNLDTSSEWFEAAGWKVVGDKLINIRPKELLSDYAVYKSDCFEDFAETFMYYRYRPEELLKISPGRYEFMKKYVYGGVEYLDSRACK